MQFVKDEEESKFFDEIKTFPPRIVGLLTPVIVDDRLTAAIQAHWHNANQEGGTLFEKLFRDGGLMGSYGARIEIGLAMGLYGELTYKDMRTIGKIRNEFAHRLPPKDFSVPPIVDWARNLKLPDHYPTIPRNHIASSGLNPTKFEIAKATLLLSYFTEVGDPQYRFVRTCEILTTLLFCCALAPVQKLKPEF